MRSLKQRAYTLLKKSEGVFRTDMIYLAKGGFWLGTGQVLSAIIGLIVTIGFANMVSPEVFGTYKYILSIYGMVALFALPGIDTAVIQSASISRTADLRQGFKIKVRYVIIGSIILISMGVYKLVTGNTQLGYSLILISTLLPLMEATGIYSALLNGGKHFKIWTYWDATIQILSAATLLSVLFLTNNLIYILAAYFLPLVGTRALAYMYTANKYITDDITDPNLRNNGISITAYQTISRLMTSIDQVILYHILGPAQLAIYSIAYAAPSRMQSLFRISGSLSFPKFVGRSSDEISKTLPKKLFLFSLIIFISCILYIIFSPILFSFLFPKYNESLKFSKVIVFFVVSSITYPFTTYLIANNKLKSVYKISYINFIVKLVLLVVLVPIAGIWGAVIALLVMSLVSIILSLLVMRGKM